LNKGVVKVFVEEIQEGQEVSSPFIIEDLRLGRTKTGKSFVGFRLKDRTGSMEARVWENGEQFFSAFKSGDAAWLSGTAESFQGRIQLKVTEAQPLHQDNLDPSLFVAASPFDLEEMYVDLTGLARSVADPDLKGLLIDILSDQDLSARLKRAPAAKRFHHAYAGGLLEHTLAVTRAASALAALYPALHRDLLLAGAILHDLGKVREFDLGLSGDYTSEGRLLGHLVLGVTMLEEKLALRPEFPQGLALLLKHLIVSHHGEYELGSPRKPKIIEALALHLLDDLDAKLNGIGGFIQRHADERTGWTDYNQLMARFFYRADLPRLFESEEKEETRRVTKSDPNQLSFLVD